MMPISLSDIAILNMKSSDNCCIISLVSTNEAIKLTQNIDLTGKVEHFKVKKYRKIFESVVKNGKNIYNIWRYWNWKNKLLRKRPTHIKTTNIKNSSI